MADNDDSAEKSHEPSPRKLEQARKKGEIARSPDLQTAFGYLAILLCGLWVGSYSLMQFGEALLPLLEQSDRLIHIFLEDGSGPVVGMLMGAVLTPLSSIFLAPGALVIGFLVATRGVVFAPEKLKPKFNRISPIDNAKNKFGRRGLFEFFKSFVKLVVYSVCLAFFLKAEMPHIISSAQSSATTGVTLMLNLMMRFLIVVVIISFMIGGIDFFWQRAEHIRKNRMSQKELRDEFKESEGDPYLKQNRRMRAQELALNQMMGEVAKSDVVIVNPIHFAVALKWSRSPGSAPVCVAKGVDNTALRIKSCAEENDVPIQLDPPTARALYATTEIGSEISPDLYKPVAAAIKFAESIRKNDREQ